MRPAKKTSFFVFFLSLLPPSESPQLKFLYIFTCIMCICLYILQYNIPDVHLMNHNRGNMYSQNWYKSTRHVIVFLSPIFFYVNLKVFRRGLSIP
jgi:hypothetical protein